MNVAYRVGNVTTADLPVILAGPNVVIAHVVNDVGAWGAGFTAALDRRWPSAGTAYRDWYEASRGVTRQGSQPYPGPPLELGNVRWQFVPPEPHPYQITPTSLRGNLFVADIVLAHMCAQHGLRARGNPQPIVYEALATCLDRVAQHAAACRSDTGRAYEVRVPRIGCGLAGGTWDRVEPLVRAASDKHGVQFVVYDLPGEWSAGAPRYVT